MTDYNNNNTTNVGGGGGGGAIQDYRQQQSGGSGGSGIQANVTFGGMEHGSIKPPCCPSSSGPRSFKIIALLVGVLLLAAGGITAGLQARKQMTWVTVDGTVVDTVMCSSGSSGGNNRND
eukprot:CAMPEP_0181022352 /NCGR_PEP_ID=MMETSP1070-20121207/1468_1 /TAXON_ID=265543 /ORGANISM="Minutocellus polymorphus, Strain NH13" /LENGTH=119 /DNA_ID=CAMNT_0023099287 /DNA_START=32 /DNA_END=388 /DNA_ORIENTATION=+